VQALVRKLPEPVEEALTRLEAGGGERQHCQEDKQGCVPRLNYSMHRSGPGRGWLWGPCSCQARAMAMGPPVV